MKHISNIILIIACLLPATVCAERISPVDGGVLTSSPGMRFDPFGSGRMTKHNGWDIAVPAGTPVHPTQEGTVYFVGEYAGYGKLVVVEHGKGYITLYGHNSEVLVTAGMQVTSDTVIALSGNSGRSTGPHVHYEIQQLPVSQQHQREAAMIPSQSDTATAQIGQPVENSGPGKGGPEQEYTQLPAW